MLVSVHSSCGVSILSFSQYPGWTLTPDGSLFMATVNDDAVGTYVCTPYNSYGSMGPSGPTKVILQVSAHSRALLSVEKLCITFPHFQCLKSACTFSQTSLLPHLIKSPVYINMRYTFEMENVYNIYILDFSMREQMTF